MRWRADRSCWKQRLTRPTCRAGWNMPIWRLPVARRRLTVSSGIELGSVRIHRIVEQEGPFFEATGFFPTITKELLDENRGWLQPRFLDAQDRLMLCIQSYIVKTPHHTIMIDSCVGNHKPRPTRPFWHMMNSDRYEKNLAAAGFSVKIGRASCRERV